MTQLKNLNYAAKEPGYLKRTCTLTRNAICCATRVAASPGLRARTSPPRGRDAKQLRG